MNKLLIAMTTTGALALAAPVTGQTGYQGSYGYSGQSDYRYRGQTDDRSGYDDRYGYGDDDRYDDGRSGSANLDARLGRMEARLQAGIRNGTIDRSEAMRLRAELRDARRVQRQYSYGGMDSQENADLRQRLRRLGQELRMAEGGSARGAGRYGYEDDRSASGSGRYDDRDGYAGSRYEDRSGYDRRDDSGSGYRGYDNGGNRNGDYGRSGRDDEDSDVGYGSLRVGQRVSGSLYGVPYQLRDRYRDGNGVYYRSDGRAIYRIDSRTNTILGIYGMDD